MNEDSIITRSMSCTGCSRLKEKIHLNLEDFDIPEEEMEKYLSATEKEILDRLNDCSNSR